MRKVWRNLGRRQDVAKLKKATKAMPKVTRVNQYSLHSSHYYNQQRVPSDYQYHLICAGVAHHVVTP